MRIQTWPWHENGIGYLVSNQVFVRSLMGGAVYFLLVLLDCSATFNTIIHSILLGCLKVRKLGSYASVFLIEWVLPVMLDGCI